MELTADELEIPCTGLGQTTWKRPEVVRGLEANDCYYFAPEKLAVADEAILRWSKDVAEYPNPDLAIEVDVSPSKIDRPAIYAALRVAEVWRFDGERKWIVIERVSEDGTYQTVDMSEFLPVRSEEVARWVLEEDRRAGSAWGRRLRAWTRAELALRLPALIRDGASSQPDRHSGELADSLWVRPQPGGAGPIDGTVREVRQDLVRHDDIQADHGMTPGQEGCALQSRPASSGSLTARDRPRLLEGPNARQESRTSAAPRGEMSPGRGKAVSSQRPRRRNQWPRRGS